MVITGWCVRWMTLVPEYVKSHQKNKLESALTDQYKNDGPGQGKGDIMDGLICHVQGAGIQQEIGENPGLRFYHSGQDETKGWVRGG